MNALNHMGQNSLSEYLLTFIKKIILEFIEDLPKKNITDPEEINFIINFYASAFVGLIILWAKGGLQENPKTHVKHIEDLIHKGLLSALQ
ncbi:MAG: TetR-like C-terminal domain-containing protein [Clostridia bacterium]|nr:TetR-like C-terminal domain-containing protein [Clostridia bacterium]